MPARYEYYEKVPVNSSDPALAEIDGELCAVLGKSCGPAGRWYYVVHVYRSGLAWAVPEDELVATREHDCRESFYSGDSIRARVDKDGRARIVDEQYPEWAHRDDRPPWAGTPGGVTASGRAVGRAGCRFGMSASRDPPGWP